MRCGHRAWALWRWPPALDLAEVAVVLKE
jgi:hypothetical protein